MIKSGYESWPQTLKQLLKQTFNKLAEPRILHHLGKPWCGHASVLCYHWVITDDIVEKQENPNSTLIMPASLLTEQM